MEAAWVFLVAVLAYLAYDNVQWRKRAAVHCLRCHSEAQPNASGARALMGGLALVFLLVGFFWLWAWALAIVCMAASSAMASLRCAVCNAGEVVPTDSPAAQSWRDQAKAP